MRHPSNYNNWPSIFWRPFLVVTLQNNNCHTSACAQKNFPIRNMRPLSIPEPPPPTGGTGLFPPALRLLKRLWRETYWLSDVSKLVSMKVYTRFLKTNCHCSPKSQLNKISSTSAFLSTSCGPKKAKQSHQIWQHIPHPRSGNSERPVSHSDES